MLQLSAAVEAAYRAALAGGTDSRLASDGRSLPGWVIARLAHNGQDSEQEALPFAAGAEVVVDVAAAAARVGRRCE